MYKGKSMARAIFPKVEVWAIEISPANFWGAAGETRPNSKTAALIAFSSSLLNSERNKSGWARRRWRQIARET